MTAKFYSLNAYLLTINVLLEFVEIFINATLKTKDILGTKKSPNGPTYNGRKTQACLRSLLLDVFFDSFFYNR